VVGAGIEADDADDGSADEKTWEDPAGRDREVGSVEEPVAEALLTDENPEGEDREERCAGADGTPPL